LKRGLEFRPCRRGTENMESEEHAAELVGKKIFSRPEVFDETVSEVSRLTGFTVVDSNLGHLGQVNEVFEYPGNPCIRITINDKQIMIPLNGIKKLDHRKRLIHTTIPDGLLDL
jgi:16S rRNA processing protein RimM